MLETLVYDISFSVLILLSRRASSVSFYEFKIRPTGVANGSKST
jgi:hypothetical protein